MEQPRFIIAVVLSFGVFLIWNYFFVDKNQVKKVEEKTEVQQTVKTEAPVAVMASKAPERKIYQESSAQQNYIPRVIKIKTPYYSVNINEKGAAITSFVLSKYKETTNSDSPNKEIIPKELEGGTVIAGFAGQSVPGLESAIFTSDIKAELIDISEGEKEILFYWKSENGIVIEKKYSFSSGTYMIGLVVNVINGSSEPIKDSLIVSLNSYYPDTTSAVGFEGPSALLNNSLEEVSLKDIEDKGVYTGTLKWISVQDRYFMSSLIPKIPVETNMRLFLKDKGFLEAQYINPQKEIRPGAQEQVEFNLFFGPKSLKLLKSLGHDLNLAINFGWFDFLAKPFLYFMNFLYSFIPNYGVAIILLTVVTKIIFWPLGAKSYKSMNEMKKIQPLLAEIKGKYGNDKKRMNEEVMGLYKTYKINPMGGCLPMVAQMPVFFALYRMLYSTIELRHAPFLFWIKDLSAPDRLFSFAFSIPFMEPPYGIPVLTIIMGATMFIQQKMTPAVGDPTQAKMMMILPFVFTVIFVNFSAGLVLYWLINNVLSILQQYIISRKAA
ncbi:MAG: membrane protein insertase YidC [Pseudomonadota bacterium]|nr:membrane protein insertase YidC [Pseudomonadota bacterium]MBU1397922.1 membrane protein insertase YidC [Pseudomonadota bacterium]MBU1570119.1 membrane protein insertase YidC [Pseudomonadota bacterium]